MAQVAKPLPERLDEGVGRRAEAKDADPRDLPGRLRVAVRRSPEEGKAQAGHCDESSSRYARHWMTSSAREHRRWDREAEGFGDHRSCRDHYRRACAK
jgi:hypothetical protein